MAETEESKYLPKGNILYWVFGMLVSAISIMYLDAKADKEFLREQLKQCQIEKKSETDRADRNEKGWIDSENSAREDSEENTKWIRERMEKETTTR